MVPVVDFWFTTPALKQPVTRDLSSTLIDRLTQLLLSPGSSLSLWSLLGALIIAAAYGVVKRKGRAVSLRALLRALFPRRWLLGASAQADLGFTLLAVFASTALFGWAVLSHVGIAAAVAGVLGQPLVLDLPTWLAVAAMTFALWLAYEFAYWLDHMLSHKIPALWAFLMTGDGPVSAGINLMVGFVALLALDWHFWRGGLAPDWWMSLRILLTGIVLISFIPVVF